MKALRLFLILALTSIVVACGTNRFEAEVATERAAIKLAKETAQGGYALISTDELKALLESGKEVVLVDAMPAGASYDKGHIAGAVNFEFPKETLESWDAAKIKGGSKEDYAKLLGSDTGRTVVAYCGFVECARSHNAAVFARELGFTDVRRHPGGIHAWRGAGHSLTTE